MEIIFFLPCKPRDYEAEGISEVETSSRRQHAVGVLLLAALEGSKVKDSSLSLSPITAWLRVAMALAPAFSGPY